MRFFSSTKIQSGQTNKQTQSSYNDIDFILTIISRYSSQLERSKIVEKAYYYYKNQNQWGEYCVVSNNCEHFATYCATGERSSVQVQGTVAAGVIGAGIGVGILAVLGGALISSSKSSKDSDWEYYIAYHVSGEKVCFADTVSTSYKWYTQRVGY